MGYQTNIAGYWTIGITSDSKVVRCTVKLLTSVTPNRQQATCNMEWMHHARFSIYTVMLL